MIPRFAIFGSYKYFYCYSIYIYRFQFYKAKTVTDSYCKMHTALIGCRQLYRNHQFVLMKFDCANKSTAYFVKYKPISCFKISSLESALIIILVYSETLVQYYFLCIHICHLNMFLSLFQVNPEIAFFLTYSTIALFALQG